jgi:(R)-2-hydroxyacyl-CoA dehydratese activating ATPase
MVVASGAFREHISFANIKKPEFQCLAKGIEHILPSTRVLLDLGARKSLAVKCFKGKAIKVVTSNKCASGNGAYLEIVKNILKLDNPDLDDLFFQSESNIEIHSNCAVFAESEIISLLHSGVRPKDIVRGVFRGLAGRIYSQLLELGIEKETAIVGGVAKSKAIVVALEEILGQKISVPDNTEIMGALGACLIGQETKE